MSAEKQAASASPRPLPARALIHVGYPRAGSSFLKRAVLSAYSSRVIVPRGALLDAFYARDARALADGIGDTIAADDVSVSASDPLVLSSEGLCGRTFWSAEGADSVARSIALAFDDPRVLIVCREQRAIIRSAWRYSIQNGRYLPRLERFVEQNAATLSRKYDYHAVRNAFRDALGKERVAVLPFEWLADRPERFSRALGDFADPPRHTPPAVSYRNESVGTRGGLETRRRANYLLRHVAMLERRMSPRAASSGVERPRERPVYEALASAVEGVAGQRPEESVATEDLPLPESLRDSYAASNAALSESSDLDLRSLGYL